MYAQTVYVELNETSCITCGAVFAIPKHMLAKLKETGGTFYCPSGHTLVYRDSDVKQLQAKLAAAEARLKSERETVKRLQRQAVAAKAQTTKLKNRIANGVCPCCNRTFTNLGRHMGTKHPDYKTQDIG